MPKNKFQEVIFTIIMVFFMVYAMICYNISLNIGGMSNEVFLSAFHELVIMGPIAFIFDFFIVSKLAFMCAAPMQVRSYALFSDIFSEKMKQYRAPLHLLNKSDIKYFNTVNLPLATSIAYFGIKNLVCGDLRRLSA